MYDLTDSKGDKMEHKIQKDDIEFKMFNEWWKLREKYYNPRTDDDFASVVKAVDEFTKKYTGTNVEWLAREMALLHAEDTERRALQITKGGN